MRGFCIPDVIASGGARLVEVGTTNKTRVDDYAPRGHPRDGDDPGRHRRSNFALTGFTEEAPLDALVALARSRSLPLVEDLGSGAFVDTRTPGLLHEPTAQRRVAAGRRRRRGVGRQAVGGPQAASSWGARR
ncbi:MAG: hypothetical protein U0325_31715 [Polyangiales bacterium]